ncbi:MAG: dimethyl sulfoxide reductase anchor subunit [Rhodospirillales bacterium]|nr:dimethyl sulfoxide reductase anchor subunit [Rhodospirillales bacterium]
MLLGTGLALVSAGLLSSTFHLGHPERAWRAFSQWRSSWLSREGVLAVVTYGPALCVGWIWFTSGALATDGRWAGLALTILALITVFATAMIYRSLATIRQWSNHWTVPCYLIFAVMTGAVVMNAVLWVSGYPNGELIKIAALSCLVGYSVKLAYWRYIDTTRFASTPATATGLDSIGEAKLFERPHSADNYLLKEMGFSVGRRHATKLRRITKLFGFLVPFGLTVLTMGGGPIAVLASILAVISVGFGIFAERWLFFAEAQHVVTLYYGADQV